MPLGLQPVYISIELADERRFICSLVYSSTENRNTD